MLNSNSSERSRAEGNMAVYLQIIGTGSSEISPSIFMFTEGNRYLFNCSESVQTVCSEHAVRFTKLRNVFITRTSWANIGGLPGLTMSLRDRGVSQVSLYGPQSLHDFKHASAIFLNQEKLNLTVHTSLDSSSLPLVYENEDMTVEGYEVFRNSPQVAQGNDKQDGQVFGSASENLPNAKRQCLVSSLYDSVVFFVGRLCKTRGKFHPDKAKLLGLPMGPLYRELVSGSPVTSPSGRVVFPHEVMDPDQPGPEFVILECPSADFIPPIISHPQLQPMVVSPTFIVHIVPKAVIENDSYRTWLAKFDPSVQNVLVHRDFCKPEVVLRSCFKVQLPLHLVDSEIFHLPMLPFRCHSTMDYPQSSVVVGETLAKLNLKPLSKCGVIENGPLEPLHSCLDDVIRELNSNNDLHCKMETSPLLKGKLLTASAASLTTKQQLSLPQETSVTFLGTAAAVPSKYRNVSAILLHLPSGYMFLDCGEGTLGQLYKCFGEDQADVILRNLKCIFVSHIHGDHHLGLLSILQKRSKLLDNETCTKLSILGPGILCKWFEDYSKSCEFISFQYQDAKHCVYKPGHVPAQLSDPLVELGFGCVSTVPVVHVFQSYGVVLHHMEGWKLVYSGDTRPSSNLVEAGKGADLLIHEATFDDALSEEAVLKKHSTLTEALRVASDMEARFTIFTHFSQRYPKFSTAMISNQSTSIAMAFDFMTVPFNRVSKLHALQPLIYDIFSVLVEDYKPESCADGLEYLAVKST